jgi:hypothetical protein
MSKLKLLVACSTPGCETLVLGGGTCIEHDAWGLSLVPAEEHVTGAHDDCWCEPVVAVVPPYAEPVNSFPGPVMVWVDLETTGLSPSRDKVLEIGLVATTFDLQVTRRLIRARPRPSLRSGADVIVPEQESLPTHRILTSLRAVGRHVRAVA